MKIYFLKLAAVAALSLFIFLVFSSPASATHGGTHIVTCDICDLCDIFTLVLNILDFLWWDIATPVAILMLIYGGGLMVIPGVGGEKTSSQLTKGKKVLLNTVIGIAIVFFAWLSIDTIIKAVGGKMVAGSTNQNYGPWNEFQCPISTSP